MLITGNKTKKRILCLALCAVLIISALSFAACGDKIPTYGTEEKYFSFIENEGDRAVHSTTGYLIQTESADYYFDKSIDAQIRNTCVFYTEKILSLLTFDAAINIHIVKNYDYYYLKEHSLYTGKTSFKDVEYITNVLLAAYGQFSNYGLAYGYANNLAKQLKWDYVASTDISQIGNDAIYDLNVLCFDTRFVSSNDILNSQKLSIAFVEDYLQKDSHAGMQSLIAKSGNVNTIDAFNTVLSSWYTASGRVYAPQTVLYSHGGETHEYVALGKFSKFFVRKDWKEVFGKALGNENFLHDNYAEIREFFEINTRQMGQYQELFDLDSYDDSLVIVFKNSNTSFYQPHIITLDTINSLTHEYIHSLTSDYCMPAVWVVEGGATWYSLYFDHYGIIILDYICSHPDEFYAPGTYRHLQEFIDIKGREISYETDGREIFDIIVYTTNLFNPNHGYTVGASFIAYLIDQYGEDTVINHLFSKNGTWAVLDKTYEQLVDEWREFILSNYSQYTQN